MASKTTSEGGNVPLTISCNASSVRREGNTVYAKITASAKNAGSWTFNDIAAWIEGTKVTLFDGKDGTVHTDKGTTYSKSRNVSWAVTADQTSKDYTVWFGWNGHNPTKQTPLNDTVSFSAGDRTVKVGIKHENTSLNGYDNATEWINTTVAYNGSIDQYQYQNSDIWNQVHYSASNITSNIDTTVNATRKRYTVSYNANNGNSTPSNQTKAGGVNLTLHNSITRSNTYSNGYVINFDGNGGSVNQTSATAIDTTTYSFSSWKDSDGSAYSGGGSYTKNKNTTMTAQWNSSLLKGSITLPSASRDKYTFQGWAESRTAASGVIGSYEPTSSKTLYATWKVNKPYNLSISVSNVDIWSLQTQFSFDGAEINKIQIYYKKKNDTSWSIKDVDNLTYRQMSLDNLSANTEYEIFLKVTNPSGYTDSAHIKQMTLGRPPMNIECTIPENTILDYSVEIRCNATAEANANISKYELINPDTNQVWKTSTSSLFYLTDVKDETTYKFKVKAYDNFNRSTISDTIYTFTTMKAKWIKIIDTEGSVKEYRCYKIDANGNKSEIRKRFIHLIKK